MIERATYDERDGRFLGFESGWCDPGAWTWVNVGPRTFCVDMAGFAFDSALLHRIPLASAVWNYTGHGGESELIGKLLGPDATAEDLQPLANCSASSSSSPNSRSFPLPHPPPLTSRRAPNSNPRPLRDENQATRRRACQRGEPPPPPPHKKRRAPPSCHDVPTRARLTHHPHPTLDACFGCRVRAGGQDVLVFHNEYRTVPVPVIRPRQRCATDGWGLVDDRERRAWPVRPWPSTYELKPGKRPPVWQMGKKWQASKGLKGGGRGAGRGKGQGGRGKGKGGGGGRGGRAKMTGD